MTPSFVEELFMRIEERLVNLERETSEIRTDLAVISDEILKCRECRTEMENVRRTFWAGRNIALALWGIIVTVLNVLIAKWIGGDARHG